MEKNYRTETPRHIKAVIGSSWARVYKRHPLTGSNKGQTLEVTCFMGCFPTAYTVKQNLLNLGWLCYFEQFNNYSVEYKFLKEQ